MEELAEEVFRAMISFARRHGAEVVYVVGGGALFLKSALSVLIESRGLEGVVWAEDPFMANVKGLAKYLRFKSLNS